MSRFSFLLLAIFLLSCGRSTGNDPVEDSGVELIELPVFQSADGELNLLMEARQVTSQLAGLQPGTWVVLRVDIPFYWVFGAYRTRIAPNFFRDDKL